MSWLWIVLGLVLIVVGLVLVLGGLTPVTHSATVVRDYEAAPGRVWGLLTDVEAFPRWRSGLARVDVRERGAGGRVTAWTEHSRFGPLPVRIVREEEPALLVGRIDGEDLGFGGTWTYRIEDLGGGRARLSITEDGEISNVLFRFLSRYVFGYDRTLRAYHADVGGALR